MSSAEQTWLFPECAPPDAERPADVPQMVRILSDFYAWVLSGQCMIRNKQGAIVPLVPNYAQIQTHKGMLAQAWRGQLIRLIRLKSRKVGVSTWIQALYYFLTKHIRHMSAETVAHTADANAEIFAITKRILHYDTTKLTTDRDSKKAIAYDMDHGSTFKTSTAGGEYVGSGSTIFFLHISELSKWPAAFINDQLLSLFNAVPDGPNTIIVIESTANQADVTGEFEKHWKAAEKGESEYLPLFTAWFHDPEARIPKAKIESRTEYEQSLVERFGIDDEQIAWLRQTLRNKCGGQEHRRRQEYPSTPDEAFQSATGKVYPMLSRVTHNLRLDVDELKSGRWQLYRGVDWGGGHPFVTVWIANDPDAPSAFTVDVMACMNTWEQLTKYARGPNNKVVKTNDDAPDAIRYAVLTGGLEGHVHIYRELFIPDSAQQGLDELDFAQTIVAMTGDENIVMTVADRSRPNSINLFNKNGVPCSAHEKPKTHLQGEVEDGIALLSTLMNGRHLLTPRDPQRDPVDAAIDHYIEREFDYGLTDGPLADRLARSGGVQSRRLIYHPWLGDCG